MVALALATVGRRSVSPPWPPPLPKNHPKPLTLGSNINPAPPLAGLYRARPRPLAEQPPPEPEEPVLG